ncbi:MAG TPA: MarR family transcriptional regulator [Oscillatoriaceae cyanobacterium]
MPTAGSDELLILYRRIKRLWASLAERSGLTMHQLMTLRLLRDSQSVSMSELTEALGITRGAVTGLIDRLEEAGLVRRRTSPEDRRLTFLELTPAGLSTMEATRAGWNAETQAWLERLPKEKRARALAALGDLIAVAETERTP